MASFSPPQLSLYLISDGKLQFSFSVTLFLITIILFILYIYTATLGILESRDDIDLCI